MNAWADLESRLRSRYPDDWPQRLQSYKDGTNADLQAWRGIGGERYDPDAKPDQKGRPGRNACFTVAPDPALIARNERIRAANRAGVPLQLMVERFGLSDSAICAVLSRFGERGSR